MITTLDAFVAYRPEFARRARRGRGYRRVDIIVRMCGLGGNRPQRTVKAGAAALAAEPKLETTTGARPLTRLNPPSANRRLLLRAREWLSERALARMWNGCNDHDSTGQILTVWIAKENACATEQAEVGERDHTRASRGRPLRR